MLIHQAYHFELDPSDQTRSRLASHCGASRFAYNWGLGLVSEHLRSHRALVSLAVRQGATISEAKAWAQGITPPVPWGLYALRREWNREKDTAAPWWRENSKEAYNSGLDALARALANFFDTRTGTRRGSAGFPRQKKRGKARTSCRFTTGVIRAVDRHHVQLPRVGVIRTKEPTTKLYDRLQVDTARVLSATVSEEAGRWFVSFTCVVERADSPARLPAAVVGVDLGVRHLAQLSTGEVVANPRALSRYERRMAHIQRELSRRKRGSKRYRRTTTKLARCHRRVAHARSDATHKLTTVLATTYGTVVIEDLNVAGMSAAPKPRPDGAGEHEHNGHRAKAGLNRSVLDASFGELRRQLTYKVAWRSGTLVVADRFFPSSKLCSTCGLVKAKLALSERSYHCERCGLTIERDLNAALNLAAYGRRVPTVAGSGPETKNARGGAHPRLRPDAPVKREDGTGQPGKTVTAAGQPVAA